MGKKFQAGAQPLGVADAKGGASASGEGCASATPKAAGRSKAKAKVKKVRLDDLLVARGLCESREAALRQVMAHEVKVGDVFATSAAAKVLEDADVWVKQQERFVSRGGHKLQGALDAFGQDVTGMKCMDIGSSTGGFSDCLLQAGAGSVACVDVNYSQLAWKIRQDPRVTVYERTNIRTASPEALNAPYDLLVADLSFIGLASLAPVFAGLVEPGGLFIGLVKPQFESAHEETNRGVVEDPEVRERVVGEVCDALQEAGFHVTGVIQSPIHGKRSGNIEFLVRAEFEGAPEGVAVAGDATEGAEPEAGE